MIRYRHEPVKIQRQIIILVFSFVKLKKLKGLEDLGIERFFYSTSSQQEKWSFWRRILSVNVLVTFIEDILKDLIICIGLDLISSIMINVDMHQVIQKLDNLGYYLLEFMLYNIHNSGIVITKPGITYLKSTVKTPELRHWRLWPCFGVFIVKIEQILYIAICCFHWWLRTKKCWLGQYIKLLIKG